MLLFYQRCNGDMRPVDAKKVQDHGLRILQLHKRPAAGLLYGLDPEYGVKPRRIRVTDDKGDIDDPAGWLCGDCYDDGLGDRLPVDFR